LELRSFKKHTESSLRAAFCVSAFLFSSEHPFGVL